MWPVVPGIPICHDLTTWKHGGPTEDDPRQVTEGPTEHGPTWITQEENPTGAPTGQSIDRGSRTNTWITQEENPTGAPTGQSIDRGSRTNRSSTVC